MSPATSQPGRLRRWWRRRSLTLRLTCWGLAALGGLVLLAIVITLLGWRYGLTPLPLTIAEMNLAPRPSLSWGAVSPSNRWFWVREAGRTLANAPPGFSGLTPMGRVPFGPGLTARVDWDLLRWTRVVQSWAVTGSEVVTNREGINEWLSRIPGLSESYARALAAPDLRRPGSGEQGRAMERGGALSRGTALTLYGLWLAQEAEHQGQTGQAMLHLLDTWRLTLGFWFDLPQSGLLSSLATAWQRLVALGPPVPRSDGLRYLAGLGELTNSLPDLEALFRLRNAHALAAETWPGEVSEDWSSLFSQLKEALRGLASEAPAFLRWVGAHFGGDPDNLGWRSGGVEYLGGPLESLCERVGARVTRPADIRRLRDAYFGGVIARLRQGDRCAALRFAASLEAGPPGKSRVGRWLDRPFVWQLPSHYRSPATSDEELRRHRFLIESARLALALRLYRDEHGHWPERLAQLTPALLATPPSDPFNDGPFQYELEANEWVLTPPGAERAAPWSLVNPMMFEPSGWSGGGQSSRQGGVVRSGDPERRALLYRARYLGDRAAARQLEGLPRRAPPVPRR